MEELLREQERRSANRHYILRSSSTKTTSGPVPCITDNKAAYDVIRNPGATKRTMHFARWMHYARELCLLNRIRMFLVGTDAMVADIFTKPLDKTAFLRCRDYLMAMTE